MVILITKQFFGQIDYNTVYRNFVINFICEVENPVLRALQEDVIPDLDFFFAEQTFPCKAFDWLLLEQ
jgi:hypothetical protein